MIEKARGELKVSRKIGILGGTFDPIHTGHLRLAQEVYEAMELDQLIFIPAYVAPHKVGLSYAEPEQRYAMTKLALADKPHFLVSDLELQRTGVSYTFHTIQQLKQQYPEDELYFIIGADTVPQLYTWHRIQELLQEVIFVAAARPGYTDVLEQAEAQLGSVVRDRVKLLNTSEYAVSSTEIRQRVAANAGLEDLVPEQVAQYIYEHGLYQTVE